MTTVQIPLAPPPPPPPVMTQVTLITLLYQLTTTAPSPMWEDPGVLPEQATVSMVITPPIIHQMIHQLMPIIIKQLMILLAVIMIPLALQPLPIMAALLMGGNSSCLVIWTWVGTLLMSYMRCSRTIRPAPAGRQLSPDVPQETPPSHKELVPSINNVQHNADANQVANAKEDEERVIRYIWCGEIW